MLTNVVRLLLVGGVPMLCLLLCLEGVAVAVEAILAQMEVEGYVSAINDYTESGF